MKSLASLLPLVLALIGSASAEPWGRMGHAASTSVSTGGNGKRGIRMGYAANEKVSTGSGSRHRRSAAQRHSRRAGPKVASSKAKRDLNSPVDPRAVSLTLHRPTQPLHERNIHPVMYFQQHLNHAHRRYAKFLGRSISDEELVHNLRRRAASLNLDFDVTQLRKRGAPLELAKGQTAGATGASGATGATGGNSQSAGFNQKAFEALTQGTVTAAGQPTAGNSLGLDIEANDVGYFATLQIGTPGTDFKILMDSGSADLWVPSTQCQNSDTGAPTCLHTTLGSNSSSTFAASQSPFQVTYGTGNVQGVLVQDNINIGGLQLNAHTFGATLTESNDFAAQGVSFDGLMGLAQSTLSNEGVKTPIEALAQAGTVANAQMGFTLGSVRDNSNTGQVTFGGVDQTKFSGSLTLFNNVNTQGFWEGAIDDVTVNGASLNLKGRTGILDTGTTLIVAPQADAEAVHAAIPGSKSDGQGGFSIPCTSTAVVAMSYGGQSFDINPADLAFQPVSNDLQGDCVSGISAGQIGGANEWLVGDVFLKNVYFATDVGNNNMGLAVINSQ